MSKLYGFQEFLGNSEQNNLDLQTYPDHVVKYIQASNAALLRTLGTDATRFEIMSLLGRRDEFDGSCDPLSLGRIKRSETSPRERFAGDCSRALINLGRDLSDADRQDPENILASLQAWSKSSIRYVFSKAIRSGPEEISESDKFSLLFHEARLIYEYLKSLGSEDDEQALFLALKFAIRSKANVSLGLFNSFAHTLYAFNVWEVNPEEYSEIFTPNDISRFATRISEIKERLVVRDAYLRISDEVKDFLSNLDINPGGLSYLKLFELVCGLNEEQRRYSFKEISSQIGSHPTLLMQRFPGIREAILSNSVKGFLTVSPVRKDALGIISQTRVGHRELVAARLVEVCNSRLSSYGGTATVGDSKSSCYVNAERNMILAVMTAAKKQLKAQNLKSPSLIDYEQASKDILEALASSLSADQQFVCLPTQLSFSNKYALGLSIRNLFLYLADVLDNDGLEDVRVGLGLRDRFVAAHLLNNPQNIKDSLLADIRTISRSTFLGDAAKELGVSASGISPYSYFFIVEAILSCEKSDSIARLSEILEVQQGVLVNLAYTSETDLMAKISNAINIVYARFGVISGLRKSVQRVKARALAESLNIITASDRLLFSEFLLLAIFNGHSCQDIARCISSIPRMHSNLSLMLTETKKALTKRPPSLKR